MKSSSQITTDLWNPELDRKYSEQLSYWIIWAQRFGLVLILAGILVLRDVHWRPHKLLTCGLVVVGFAALFGYKYYVWHDVDRTRAAEQFGSERGLPMNEAIRKTKILRATLTLILLDSMILSILIQFTGGPGKSVLDPLVPIIPIIAVILRQPKRTVYWAFSSGILLVALAIFDWLFGHTSHLSAPVTEGLVAYTHRDPLHPLSFCIVTGGALALSVLELTSYNKPEIGRDVETNIAELVNKDRRLQGIHRAIKRGSRRWIKWLAHRDLPLADLSLVHEPEDILKQALVLAAPYWVADGDWKYKMFTRRRITRHITFLTFSAHWIDDHFDALERYCQDKTLRDRIRKSSPAEILDDRNPRLEELLQRMERAVLPRFVSPRLFLYGIFRLKKKQKAILPPHVKMVRRAVERVIYGGLIQNAEADAILVRLIDQYYGFIKKGLSDDLVSLYSEIYESDCRLVAWTTAKVVMELFDAAAPTFSQNESEFFSLLYAPLLYYHDNKKEATEERFGEAFIKADLPGLPHMIDLVSRCRTLMPKVLGSDTLTDGRRLQLKLLLSMYGENEKEIMSEYNKFLGKSV